MFTIIKIVTCVLFVIYISVMIAAMNGIKSGLKDCEEKTKKECVWNVEFKPIDT